MCIRDRPPSAHVLNVVVRLPPTMPFQLCADVVPLGPISGIGADANAEHRLPKFPKLDVAGNQVPALVLHQGRRK
eukprot:11216614-Alexandrium_andersonii.AAC.1